VSFCVLNTEVTKGNTGNFSHFWIPEFSGIWTVVFLEYSIYTRLRRVGCYFREVTHCPVFQFRLHGMGRTFRKKFKRRQQGRVFKRKRFGGGRNAAFDKRVKRVIQKTAEHKFTDYKNSLTAISTAIGQVYNDPLEGTTDNLRVGDKIELRSVKVRYQLTFPDATNFVRLIVLLWEDPTTPLVSEILQDTASATDTLNSPYHHYNLQSKRFIPLYDKTFVGGTGTNVGTGTYMTSGAGPIRYGTLAFYGKRLPKKKIVYSDGTANKKWEMFFLLVSDSGVAPSPMLTWTSRITFTDV